ncbi:hypothetical protein [Streptomyces sp. NPDC053367]|uniref:hypothetical protein n=1 Tax=Streptomyces sp. NPDC053367 TaxID=3365700 RepID=UPI0037CFA63D
MTTPDDRTPPPAPPTPGPDDDEYSATVLATHWIQGPEPDEPGTLRMRDGQPEGNTPAPHPGLGAGETRTLRMQDREPRGTVSLRAPGPDTGEAGATLVEGAGPRTTTVPDHGPGPSAGTVRVPAPVPGGTVALPGPGTGDGAPEPDRVEGTVLRFGPGVTAAVAERTLRPAPVVPEPPAPRPRAGWRRYALPAVVLLCVLAFLAWQRLGPSVRVRSVTVAAGPAELGCGATSDIVARVTTDGRPGTLTYRWIRSDGTASGVLRETLARGQREARLHLQWTFEGEGHLTGQADLRILTPDPRTVTAEVTYDCP